MSSMLLGSRTNIDHRSEHTSLYDFKSCTRFPKVDRRRHIYKLFAPINVNQHSRLVSCSIPLPFFIRQRQHSKRTWRCKACCIKYAAPEVASSFIPYTKHSVSSDRSSPQTSIFYGSPRGSQSPPSSQNSAFDNPSTQAQVPRRPPRIQVSSLLADPQTRTYHLEVVQHPQKTAEFGHSNLSRLPITPSIIAQLIVRDSAGNSVVPEAELPFLIAHLSLFSDDGLTRLDMGSYIGNGSGDRMAPPILYGNIVASVDRLEDLQGNLGLFFLFPDVSVRWRGRYQLGVTLIRLAGADFSGSFGLTDLGTVLAEARTSTFEVVELSQYTAVPPTRLTQCFVRQGARMFTYMPASSS